MLKSAIISSSALGLAGRWDASFHLLQETHKDRIADLKKVFGTEEARATAKAMFEAVPAQHRKLLAPLLRGNDVKSPSTEALAKAAHEYPYIVIATFEANRNVIKATIQELIVAAEASKAQLFESLNTIDQNLAKKD